MVRNNFIISSLIFFILFSVSCKTVSIIVKDKSPIHEKTRELRETEYYHDNEIRQQFDEFLKEPISKEVDFFVYATEEKYFSFPALRTNNIISSQKPIYSKYFKEDMGKYNDFLYEYHQNNPDPSSPNYIPTEMSGIVAVDIKTNGTPIRIRIERTMGISELDKLILNNAAHWEFTVIPEKKAETSTNLSEIQAVISTNTNHNVKKSVKIEDKYKDDAVPVYKTIKLYYKLSIVEPKKNKDSKKDEELNLEND